MKLFLNYFRNKRFSKKKKKKNTLCKRCGYFLKIADVVNNKLMGLLIIDGGGLLLSQEHIKERRKRRQLVGPRIRRRDSKGAYYSIINDLRLTDKEDFS